MDMYFIHKRLRDFNDKNKYLYSAFTVFITMISVIFWAGIFFAPIVLTSFYTPLWLLSIFIVYPLEYAGVCWECDCFDF